MQHSYGWMLLALDGKNVLADLQIFWTNLFYVDTNLKYLDD